jgi:uncharacterized membrane protein
MSAVSRAAGNRTIKIIAIWIMMGMVYLTIEGVYRLITDDGRVHIAMLPVGGLCGLAVGGINQVKAFYRLPVLAQSTIGTLITLAVEFVTGCILNLWLGMAIWDYSALPGNILGQVCVRFAGAWFLLMPFAIWLEDRLRWRLWAEGVYYTLPSIYLELVTLR